MRRSAARTMALLFVGLALAACQSRLPVDPVPEARPRPAPTVRRPWTTERSASLILRVDPERLANIASIRPRAPRVERISEGGGFIGGLIEGILQCAAEHECR